MKNAPVGPKISATSPCPPKRNRPTTATVCYPSPSSETGAPVSGSARFRSSSAALLVFLPAAARARIIAADFRRRDVGQRDREWLKIQFGKISLRLGEIAVCVGQRNTRRLPLGAEFFAHDRQ